MKKTFPAQRFGVLIILVVFANLTALSQEKITIENICSEAPETENKINFTGKWKSPNKYTSVIKIVDPAEVSMMIPVIGGKIDLEACRFGNYILGKVNDQSQWFVISMNKANQLSFYSLKIKSNENAEQILSRIKKRLKKKPDEILYRFD